MTEEIKAKLSLDHTEAHKHAKELEKEFEKMGEELSELREKGREFGGELGGALKGALSMAAGIELAGMVEAFKSAGEEVIHTASALEDQEKAIRGVLMMIDEEGASLDELGEEAHHLNEEFASMSMASGQSKEAIVSAFDEMAERTDMSTAKVKELTEEMSQAGRAIPGGIGSLSSGFANLASGMIRARNPIVQMITATGLLHGNAKQVAKELQKMTPESVMKVGIAAVEKMSGKMKNVPLTFNEAIASFKTMREEVFEGIGTPLVRALTGPLGEIRDYFTANREEIQKWAEHAGEDAGRWLKEGFRYLEEHGTEIKKSLADGAAAVKDAALALGEVIHFMWDHREAIAIAYGASKLGGLSMGVAKGGMTLAGAIPGLLGGASKAGGMILGGEGGGLGGALAGGGAAAGLATIAAGVAAIASVGAAVYEAGELWKELPSKAKDADVEYLALEEATKRGQIAWAQELRDRIVVLNPELAVNANNLVKMAKSQAAVNAIMGESSSRELELWASEAAKGGKRAAQAATFFIQDFSDAAARGDSAAEDQMASFLITHADLMDAMHMAGVDITKGGAALATTIESLGEQIVIASAGVHSLVGHHNKLTMGGGGEDNKTYAEEVRGILAKQLKDKDVSHMNLNFTGDIHIQQDFKDQNPDRVLLEFKKELSRSALSRTSAATQTPHTAF